MIMYQRKFKMYLFAALLFLSASIHAQVQMPPMFSDNMVLQQQSDVSIWGKAKPGATIKVETSWDKAKYNTKSDGSGNWTVIVKTPTAGGPYDITISDKKKLQLKNVMIGEVWICS